MIEGCKQKNACCTLNIFCVAVVTRETCPPSLVKFTRMYILHLYWACIQEADVVVQCQYVVYYAVMYCAFTTLMCVTFISGLGPCSGPGSLVVIYSLLIVTTVREHVLLYCDCMHSIMCKRSIPTSGSFNGGFENEREIRNYSITKKHRIQLCINMNDFY